MIVGQKVSVKTTTGARAVSKSGLIISAGQAYRQSAIITAIACKLPTYNATRWGHNDTIIRVCKTKQLVFTQLRFLEPIENKGEEKMRDLRVGDKVNMWDDSWAFGVENGKYSTHRAFDLGERDGLTVIKTNLNTMRNENGDRHGAYNEICDILVTNGNGDFWFTRSKLVRLCNPKHTVSFDGGQSVTISDQSYQALKKSLTSQG